MPTAWFIDDLPGDFHSEHHLNPPQFINFTELCSETGIKYWKFDVDNFLNDQKFTSLLETRGYISWGSLEISKKALPDYDEKIEHFYKEHIHEREEIVLILEGIIYWDVRDKNDRWVRIKAEEGDMLSLPAGIYHRLTVGPNYATLQAFYCGLPVFTPIFRPADDHPVRLEYLNKIVASDITEIN